MRAASASTLASSACASVASSASALISVFFASPWLPPRFPSLVCPTAGCEFFDWARRWMKNAGQECPCTRRDPRSQRTTGVGSCSPPPSPPLPPRFRRTRARPAAFPRVLEPASPSRNHSISRVPEGRSFRLPPPLRLSSMPSTLSLAASADESSHHRGAVPVCSRFTSRRLRALISRQSDPTEHSSATTMTGCAAQRLRTNKPLCEWSVEDPTTLPWPQQNRAAISPDDRNGVRWVAHSLERKTSPFAISIATAESPRTSLTGRMRGKHGPKRNDSHEAASNTRSQWHRRTLVDNDGRMRSAIQTRDPDSTPLRMLCRQLPVHDRELDIPFSDEFDSRLDIA